MGGVREGGVGITCCLVQSSRPANQYEKERYEVWRRYRDFEWLREILERHHFTLIVPVRKTNTQN